MSKAVSESTKAKAVQALEGMREIVRAEMLVQGTYVDDEISNPRRVGSLCGGHKYCAIGSLWVGAGIAHKIVEGRIVLPGVALWQRHDYVRHRPGLKLALTKLNEAAREFASDHALEVNSYGDAIEELFESYYGDYLAKRDLLGIIASAKRQILKG